MEFEVIKVGEFNIRIYPYSEYISDELRKHGSYEAEYIKLIQKYIRPGNTVLDIGANIGLHTLHFSKAVGQLGKVLAFEPDPINLELLRFNVEKNECNNVVIYPFALGESTTNRELFLCNRNKGKQSFADLDGLNAPIMVEVRKAIDFPDINLASVVKMDVEGAEPLVFDGFEKFKPPVIFFEFTIKQLLAVQNNPLEFLKRLIKESYKISVVDGEQVHPIEPEEFVTLASLTNKDYNLLAELENDTADNHRDPLMTKKA